MKNKKIAIIPIIVFLIAIVLIICNRCFSDKSGEENYLNSVYKEYAKMSKPTIKSDNVIYHIDYMDYISGTDKYQLEVDRDGNYDLIYVKYKKEEASVGQNYYFRGTFSEKDFDSFKQIISQMESYLEGIKKDYNNYEFYYNYEDIKEQNENGNKFLKAIMTEIINHTIYNKDGNRISNFEEILSIIGKFNQNPNLDLDAELVLNEKGVIQEETKPQFGKSEETETSEEGQGNGNSSSGSEKAEKDGFESVPLATGEKQATARLDRIIIDFKDDASDSDIVSVVQSISSGILFRFESGKRFIVTVDGCTDEAQVLEKCKAIKETCSEYLENTELCYE